MRYHNSIPWITDASAHGLDLPISWDDGEAVLSLTMPRTSQAAPGGTHGGCLPPSPGPAMGVVAGQNTAGGVIGGPMVGGSLAPTPSPRAGAPPARAATGAHDPPP